MFGKLDAVVHRYETLTDRLGNPEIYENPDELRKINEERSSLEDIVHAYKNYQNSQKALKEAQVLLREESDSEMREMAKEEISENEKKLESLSAELKVLLLPKDPLDDKDVMVEIRAGAGGDEASIFVADVWRMYQNYFRSLHFKMEMVSISEGDEGVKEVILAVRGEKVYSKLKYESGVHRVQRVPKTESQGRVHTSTITVAVLPEADAVDFELDMTEVRIDVYRASGSGGQHVNTTDSAVRATHIPTGVAVAIQDEKSQHKNKDKALKILRTRIYDDLVRKKHLEEAAERKGLIGSGDRSERIRTYNFPQGRLTDHRIGLTLYSLDKVIEGDLAEVTEALTAYNQAILLKGGDEETLT